MRKKSFIIIYDVDDDDDDRKCIFFGKRNEKKTQNHFSLPISQFTLFLCLRNDGVSVNFTLNREINGCNEMFMFLRHS
jgi:hypothetical protein